MKNFIIYAGLLVIVGLLSFIWGCSDSNKNDSSLNPGNPNDPSFLIFASTFGDMGDVNGEMFNTGMEFVDQLLNPTTPPDKLISVYYFEYHQSSQFWYCSTSVVNASDGGVYALVDTIQFVHGNYIVQWPKPDSLTQIVTQAFIKPIDPPAGMDSLYATQGGIFSVPEAGSDTLNVLGSGSIYVDYSFTNADTTCNVIFDYDVTYNNLKFYISAINSGIEGGPCPFGGSLGYTGTANISCTYTGGSISVTGSWAVTEVFDNGSTTLTFSNGTNTWTKTDDCTTGAPGK